MKLNFPIDGAEGQTQMDGNRQSTPVCMVRGHSIVPEMKYENGIYPIALDPMRKMGIHPITGTVVFHVTLVIYLYLPPLTDGNYYWFTWRW
jgi:hypothetical protein